MEWSPVTVPLGWVGMETPYRPWTDVLAAVADRDDLVCLHDGTDAWLGWGGAAVPVADWTGLAGTSGHGGEPEQAGWWSPAGAAVVQLDAEAPAVPAWRWNPTTWVACRGDGGMSILATDGAALARARALLVASIALPPPLTASGLAPDWDEPGHIQRVDALRERIAAGDIYQANLTLAWRGRRDGGSAAALFARLVATSPARRAALLVRPGRSIVCHSPETFLRWGDGVIRTDPIKGTRPRDGAGLGRSALLASAKDHAELAMIVDLMRNDLGRCAVPGSVRVEHAAALLDLPHLHHLVARVAARLRPDTNAPDLLAATFPPGSVTGCPKAMAQRCIAAVEAGPRGPYCGALGWIGPQAGDLAVAIRVAVISGDHIAVHAGGGITAESDGAAEWAEANTKAAPLLRALGG
jgi:anthranilate/para-aminobenzoate synthase component I